MTHDMTSERRFQFGRNWNRFIARITPERISSAKDSLIHMLGHNSLNNMHFLDVGSGSGMFSLAAHQLGAQVRSFDYDEVSVATTAEVRKRYAADSNSWCIEQGSVLDEGYMRSLGRYDVVYAWGVLHHTGDMLRALANVGENVTPSGQLFVAIYNKQPFKTRYWKVVKKAYNKNAFNRIVIVLTHMPYFYFLRGMVRFLSGKHRLERGMSLWHDMLDWLGGYPFEAAAPEEIVDFYLSRGFILQRLRTVGGRAGCNEFVFQRPNSTPA